MWKMLFYEEHIDCTTFRIDRREEKTHMCTLIEMRTDTNAVPHAGLRTQILKGPGQS